MDVTDVVGRIDAWALALNLVFVVILPVELVWLRRRGRLDRRRVQEMVASAVQFVPLLLTSVAVLAAWAAVFAAVDRLLPWRIEVTPWSVAAAVVLADFLYYWEHRSGHRVNAFWSLYHSVHHSSPVYDQSTAFRLSAVDGSVGTAFFLPLVLVGFPAPLALAAYGLVIGYQTWIHTETVRRLPRVLEWVLNTPSHHRVHHGINPEYLDRNYGGILIVWDRIFGTFEAERAPVSYGLTTQIGNTRWLDVQRFELCRTFTRLHRATTWSDRLQILVRPPGWAADRWPLPAPAVAATRPPVGAGR